MYSNKTDNYFIDQKMYSFVAVHKYGDTGVVRRATAEEVRNFCSLQKDKIQKLSLQPPAIFRAVYVIVFRFGRRCFIQLVVSTLLADIAC